MKLMQQATNAVITMPQTDGVDHQKNHRVNYRFKLWSFNYERQENFEQKCWKRKCVESV